MRILGSRIVCFVLFVSASTMTGLHAQQVPPTSTVLTPVPRLMWFSGAFRPADNLPIALVESVTVTVYRDQNGGDALWQETQQVSMASDGRYSLLLGSTLPDGLPLELFTSGEPRWIGIIVHRPGEAEQPRVHLASVAYALKAADADTLGGHPASAYRLTEPSLSPAASGASDRAPADTTTAASSGTASYLGMFVDSTNLGNSALFQSAGFVGVGTTAPRDGFHVAVNDGTGTFTGYAVQNLSPGAGAYSGMLFYDQNGALGQFQGFNNASHEYRINNIASGGRINFLIGSSSKFLVANNGNIGVGVAVPGSKLDVAGSINASTQYNLGGSRMVSVGSGPGNLFVGIDAGRDSTSSSSQNAFFGVSAGMSTVNGINNAFFAHLAGLFNISGSANSFFGASAGLHNTTGSYNSFFGLEAGYYHTAGTGNAFFGSGTGHSNTTESFNTFIGSSSNGAATITNATALGYQAQVTQSNSLVLGSITGFNGALADTNVGIGTTAPKTKLHVVGGAIYIAQPHSLVITSPNGNCWFITVNDSGVLGANLIACPS